MYRSGRSEALLPAREYSSDPLLFLGPVKVSAPARGAAA
jgi:hypothetical protein